MHKPSTHVANPDDGFELTDIQVKVILFSGVVMIVLSATAFFVSFLYTKMLVADQRPTVSDYETSVFTQEHNAWDSDVRLQPSPPATLKAHQAEQAAASRAFGIVSESPEIYRIDVDAALDHVAEHGLPVWEAEPLN
jgi:hypothetical protein